MRLSCVFLAAALLSACSGSGAMTPQAVDASASATTALTGRVPASSTAGRAGTMPAYYDDQLFTINFNELSPNAEQQVLQNNKSINIIYCVTDCTVPPFVPVINAIQGAGPGFNPLWNEVHIIFNTVAFKQYTSDTAILTAAAAGQITLMPTTEVYRCSVIGPSKP
jgi:hypothetical protein